MPEAGRHAPILIAVSWQALNRALREGPDTQLCNCAIVVLFAGFYLEANLNYIIEKIDPQGFETFTNRKKYPGLQPKMIWFHNEFIARKRLPTIGQAFDAGAERMIRRRFRGFAGLYDFRNEISHGKIGKRMISLARTQKLRQQAKDIVSDMFSLLKKRGHDLPRDTTYYAAIS